MDTKASPPKSQDAMPPAPGEKPRGLFLNTQAAKCSIHESGNMAYQGLMLSKKYQLDYLEFGLDAREIPLGYDFYIFNYHYAVTSWFDTKCLSALPGLKLTLLLETFTNDPFVLCPEDSFDAYLAIDPTMNVADKRVYAMPRPLEVPGEVSPYYDAAIPVIGSFGFATPGKGFELVVDAVNKEFAEAIVKINLAPGTHTDDAAWVFQKRDFGEYIAELCQRVAKKGIQVVVTRDYMTKDGLIEWCSQNTLNCFLYNRNQPGLAATTDQAISSGRPLAVSTNETFRHIHPYVEPYPFQSLKESIASSQAQVLQMQKDWAPKKFAEKFEEVLGDFGLLSEHSVAQVDSDTVTPRTPPGHSRSFKLETLVGAVPPETLGAKSKRALREINIKVRSTLKIRTRVKRLLGKPQNQSSSPGSWNVVENTASSQLGFDIIQSQNPMVRPRHSRENTILIVNHTEEHCGIHQYGLNISEALQKSSRYGFAYAECSSEAELLEAVAASNPAAIIYNYYPATMPWLTSEMTRRFAVPQLGMMHEVTQEAADEATREMFDYHLGPDPTLIENNPYVFKTRRLIPPYINYKFIPDVVTIGTFGFRSEDKGFERLIHAVQHEFDEARIVMNVPLNDFVGTTIQEEVLARIQYSTQRLLKPGIEVIVTHDFLTKRQLLDFLASNTLNAFFYNPHKRLGISSTIEHALAVQRPLAITRCDMFRHVYSASPSICIEDSSLKQIINNGIAPLVPFYNDWSEANFILDYERILDRVLGKQSHAKMSVPARQLVSS